MCRRTCARRWRSLKRRTNRRRPEGRRARDTRPSGWPRPKPRLPGRRGSSRGHRAHHASQPMQHLSARALWSRLFWKLVPGPPRVEVDGPNREADGLIESTWKASGPQPRRSRSRKTRLCQPPIGEAVRGKWATRALHALHRAGPFFCFTFSPGDHNKQGTFSEVPALFTMYKQKV